MESPQVVRSVLSPARAATRQKVIAAAIELATEGGYDAVAIRPVAARAGVSVPTVYQHVSCKDQLLAEALMFLGGRSTEGVRRHRPAGDTPADRVVGVFSRILDEAAAKPLLYQALYRAWVAALPGVVGDEGAIGLGPERAQWIGEALRAGPHDQHTEDDLDAAARVLSMLFLGGMVGVAAGRPVDEVVAILDEASHRLLP